MMAHPFDSIPSTWTAIKGFFDYSDVYDSIADMASEGDLVVEVGCYLGRSGIYLGEKLKLKGARLIAVDLWPWVYVHGDDPKMTMGGTFDIFCSNVRQSNLEDVVIPLRCPSNVASKIVRDNLAAVFIDADHSYESAKEDITLWLPKVRPGGILAGHDFNPVDFPGVVDAVNELLPGRYSVSKQTWIVRV